MTPTETGPWKCYHCGYVAQNHNDAIAHFGEDGDVVPLCLADPGEIGEHMKDVARRLRAGLDAYNDTDDIDDDMIAAVGEAATLFEQLRVIRPGGTE